MVSAVKNSKVVATLPTILVADTLYYVRVGKGFDLYLSNIDGTTAHKLNAVDAAGVGSAASGSTLGLEQSLIANDGQIGKTVLACLNVWHEGTAGPSLDHKAIVTSLGSGNIGFHYATPEDFLAGNPTEGPVFLELGEVYVFQNVQRGSIFTFSEGGYGFSQQRQGSDMSPMPLASLALAYKDSFAFAFRNSNNGSGQVFLINGAVSSVVTMRTGEGAVVLDQSDIELDPFEFLILNTNGTGEYRITATNPVMAGIAAEMRVSTNTPRFYDSRLWLPLSVDAITWPRSGFLSALYDNTVAQSFVNDNTSNGTITTSTISPGLPVDYDGATGATDSDYEPRGATRTKGGLHSALSGADSSGLESTPTNPVKFHTQRQAIPCLVRNSGDGGNNGIAAASIYTGTAKLYQWNPVTRVAELVTVNDPSGNPVTEIKLVRRNGAVDFQATTREHQNYPASFLISPSSDNGAYRLLSDFTGGYIEFDVYATCVFNSENGQNINYRGTSSVDVNDISVAGIYSNDDEQLTYGITPKEIKAEITTGKDGLLYKRVINAGSETWVVA